MATDNAILGNHSGTILIPLLTIKSGFIANNGDLET